MSDTPTLSRDAVWGLGAALVLHAVMIALAVAWVAFYSFVVEPGHDQAFYDAHAQVSSPIVSVVAGGPVFYLVAAWLARRRGTGRAAWIAAALYLLTDVVLFAAVGALLEPIMLYLLGGAVLKLGGTALGIKRARA